MTDQEINEAVAGKLGKSHICDPRGCLEQHKDYCHSIAAAWEVVEKIHNQVLFTLWWHDGEWECDIEINERQPVISIKADTAPMAICLAFLKLP